METFLISCHSWRLQISPLERCSLMSNCVKEKNIYFFPSRICIFLLIHRRKSNPGPGFPERLWAYLEIFNTQPWATSFGWTHSEQELDQRDFRHLFEPKLLHDAVIDYYLRHFILMVLKVMIFEFKNKKKEDFFFFFSCKEAGIIDLKIVFIE